MHRCRCLRAHASVATRRCRCLVCAAVGTRRCRYHYALVAVGTHHCHAEHGVAGTHHYRGDHGVAGKRRRRCCRGGAAEAATRHCHGACLAGETHRCHYDACYHVVVTHRCRCHAFHRAAATGSFVAAACAREPRPQSRSLRSSVGAVGASVHGTQQGRNVGEWREEAVLHGGHARGTHHSPTRPCQHRRHQPPCPRRQRSPRRRRRPRARSLWGAHVAAPASATVARADVRV